MRLNKKEIPITHNYSLNTVGKGALYLPVLAQHSTVPLIATLLLMHCTFCYILLRHLKAHPYAAALKTEKLLKLCMLYFSICL